MTSSYVQSWTAKSFKSDLILNFKKPYSKSFSVNASDILKNNLVSSANVNVNVNVNEGIDRLDAKDIIVSSAKQYLSKNKKQHLQSCLNRL